MADTHLLERRRVRAEAEPRTEPPFRRRPAYQAYRILHAGFTVAPILAGLDKFFHLMTHWDMYVAGTIARILPVSVPTFMLAVGVIEIAAGVLVAILPRIGAFVVAGWLGAIILNLLLMPGFYDIALRDLGLALGALALGLLAREFDRPAPRNEPRVQA
jgi:hypothetical protein